MLKTFQFDCARSGDMFGDDIIAETETEAQAGAVDLINSHWRERYSDWDDMAEDMDGCVLIEHPAIMAQRLPLATISTYRTLVRGLRDMIDGQRLTEADCPDDFQWLGAQLDTLASLDPEA
jgi:hypothetical protein